jgi:hypothetical protein
MSVANELGFDAVDSGSLSDSWRQQPGTPAYCTELTKEELEIALTKANKEKAPFLRDKVMEKLVASDGDFPFKMLLKQIGKYSIHELET